jgi:hypothetical protein
MGGSRSSMHLCSADSYFYEVKYLNNLNEKSYNTKYYKL